MTPPGLTCAACSHPLYPLTATITDDGYRHTRCPRFCEIEGCDGQHRARGWCDLHYSRWASFGHPLTYKGFEVEDIEWMVECGVGLDEAAGRCNLLPGSLAKRLRDLGRHDLSDALIARNPRDWNRVRVGNDTLPTTRNPLDEVGRNARRNEKRKAERRERAAA